MLEPTRLGSDMMEPARDSLGPQGIRAASVGARNSQAWMLQASFCCKFAVHPVELHNTAFLGRALGHFIFSLIGLKRILFSNIFQKP